MESQSLKFYNMQVHLIKNNRIYEENVAVKNIWKKDNNIFLDLYFYRKKKSYIFDAVFVHDIIDLSTEKVYRDMSYFLSDFENTKTDDNKATVSKSIVDNKIFETIESDLVILTFMASCCGNYTMLKEKIILDYMLSCAPQAQNLSHNYLDTYLSRIVPKSSDFYHALDQLDYSRPHYIENLCREVLKVCLADGRMHHKEKRWLSEMLYILRDAGIKINLAK
ncbi:MAG: hypothetical protein E7019_06200 [Alphaproteobacteria bacterium]|nr:hypothetical protein [Alphaproteobacteria bacterium]